MKRTILFLQKLEKEPIKTSDTKNGLIITTTQRNKLKNELVEAIGADIIGAITSALRDEKLTEYVFIGETAEGLIVAPENEKVPYSIPFKINIKVGGLDYDAEFEINDYQVQKDLKEAEKQKRAEAKARKIANK